MGKVRNLYPLHVVDADVGDYSVTEPGWYATDDGGKIVLGPFESLAQCERAIRDRLQSTAEPIEPEAPT